MKMVWVLEWCNLNTQKKYGMVEWFGYGNGLGVRVIWSNIKKNMECWSDFEYGIWSGKV